MVTVVFPELFGCLGCLHIVSMLCLKRAKSLKELITRAIIWWGLILKRLAHRLISLYKVYFKQVFKETLFRVELWDSAQLLLRQENRCDFFQLNPWVKLGDTTWVGMERPKAGRHFVSGHGMAQSLRDLGFRFKGKFMVKIFKQMLSLHTFLIATKCYKLINCCNVSSGWPMLLSLSI